MIETKKDTALIRRYFLLPFALTVLFLFSSYFAFTSQIRFSYFFPFYVVFTVIVFFNYNIFAAVVLQSFITVIGLVGIIFVEGGDRLGLLGMIIYGWLLLMLFLRYERREHDNKQRLDVVFEEMELNIRDEEQAYIKDTGHGESAKERLRKYHELYEMANQFTNTLETQEIITLVIKTIKDIIKTGTIRIANPDDESIFTEWVRKQEVPLFIENLEKDYRFPKGTTRAMAIRSAMVVPLWNEHKVHAFIEITSSQPLAYLEEDLRMVLIIADIASLAITNAALFARKQELVVVDGLTGVFNRRYFMEILDEELRRAKRYEIDCALLMIDIDYFKHYNDTYGHLEGDSILKKVSTAFTENLRETDVIARYGGEEFAVLLSMVSLENAYRKAEQLREHVEASCGVTISIGVAMATDEITVEQLITTADNALYKAKAQGRNRVVCAHS